MNLSSPIGISLTNSYKNDTICGKLNMVYPLVNKKCGVNMWTYLKI